MLHASDAKVNVSKMAVLPMPGSDHVLDRSTGELVACTLPICPLAKRSGNYADGSPRWVNRVPVMHSSWVACVSELSSPAYQVRKDWVQ